MSKQKVRWGVLGVAKINERVFPSFLRTPHAVLAGIASRDGARAAEAAKQWGIPRSFSSYGALIASEEIDLVYNPLPNHLHDHYTRLAADHGKVILCEKPLCPTAAQAQSLVDHCEKKKALLMDGFMWPHHPRTNHLREIIRSGRIGKVKRVCGAFTFSMDPIDPENIRLKPEMGGGSLLDVGCYPVYGIRWAFGEEPVRVMARAEMRHGVDLEMAGVLEFADGRMATFDCGFTHPLRMQLEIVGEKGIIRVPRMWLPEPEASFEIEYASGAVEKGTFAGHDQIACMIENLSRKALGQAVDIPGPMEAVRTLKVLDALAQSARQQKAVEVA